MTDPKFRRIKPNYRKNAFEVTLQEGRTRKNYVLPFSVLIPSTAGRDNRVTSIVIDKELRETVVLFMLEDGSKGEFPSDIVLYYCEPSYEWSPVNQIKRALNGKLGKSKLSARVVADGLRIYPTEILRLLQGNFASAHFPEVIRLAELAGYRIEFKLKKTPAA